MDEHILADNLAIDFLSLEAAAEEKPRSRSKHPAD
jgi:hypothetical protein